MSTRLTARITVALGVALGLSTAACSQSEPGSQSQSQPRARPDQHITGDSTARVTGRRPLGQSTFHIVSVDGNEALMLTDTSIVAQLTDTGLQHASHDADSSMKQKGLASRMVSGMVGGLLQTLFNHGIEYNLHDLTSAQYTDGRLVLRSRDGNEPFSDVDMFGHQLMTSFSAADARAFAARAELARGRLK